MMHAGSLEILLCAGFDAMLLVLNASIAAPTSLVAWNHWSTTDLSTLDDAPSLCHSKDTLQSSLFWCAVLERLAQARLAGALPWKTRASLPRWCPCNGRPIARCLRLDVRAGETLYLIVDGVTPGDYGASPATRCWQRKPLNSTHNHGTLQAPTSCRWPPSACCQVGGRPGCVAAGNALWQRRPSPGRP